MARQIQNHQIQDHQIQDHRQGKSAPQQAADAVIAQMYGYFDAEAPRPQPVANDYQPPLAA